MACVPEGKAGPGDTIRAPWGETITLYEVASAADALAAASEKEIVARKNDRELQAGGDTSGRERARRQQEVGRLNRTRQYGTSPKPPRFISKTWDV